MENVQKMSEMSVPASLIYLLDLLKVQPQPHSLQYLHLYKLEPLYRPM